MSIDSTGDGDYNCGIMSHTTPDNKPLVLSREEVRNCDRVAIERYGINGLVLMENAGSAAARWVLQQIRGIDQPEVCIVAGPGNNGGDGFVVARHLYNAGVTVHLLLFGTRERFRGDALANLVVLENMGAPIEQIAELDAEGVSAALRTAAAKAEIVVDALLGTGTAGPPREPIRTAIRVINQLSKRVLALDIPSGLDCDSGERLGSAVRAEHTVTFAAMKKGFLNLAAAEFTGTIEVASIGIDARLLRA